jgi:hypothetical protein
MQSFKISGSYSSANAIDADAAHDRFSPQIPARWAGFAAVRPRRAIIDNAAINNLTD